MDAALLVSEQRPTWKVLATPPSAAAAWEERVLEKAGGVSPSPQGESWRIVALPSSESSPFEYQSAVIHTMWLPTAKSQSVEHRPGNAKQALEQIRALHRKQETRRREEEEAEWIRANRTRYAGRWVALLGANLLAEGDSARAVVQASAAADAAPLIVYLENELHFTGW